MPGAATDNPRDESRPGAVHASWGWRASSRSRARGPALARARLVPPPPRHPRPALDARGRHCRLRRRAAIRGVSRPLGGGRGRCHGRAGGRSAGPTWAHPWLWAGIHGAFILAMSAVTLTTWRVTETASALTEIVLDSAGEGVVGVDLQGRTTFVNAAAARMLRCSAEDLIGRPLGAVILHPPDPAGAPCRLYANMSVGPAPDAAEDFFKSVDRRAFPVEYVSSQIREHGNVEGAVVVFRDVSQRRTAQTALQESEARLRQSQKMDAIGQLAGGIAHDFSNLLTVIIGRGELLRGRLTSSSDRETVSLITETAERASILTRQLLAFSRKQVLEPRVLDLGEVVAGMASMLRRLIGEHISFITAIDPNGTPVWGDVAQLEQVILNLAVNARDAMPTGGSLTVAVDTVLGPEPQV